MSVPLGPFSFLWECSGEGKQRLNWGKSPDLATELNVLQFGKKKKKSNILATTEALFQNVFHSGSNYYAYTVTMMCFCTWC